MRSFNKVTLTAALFAVSIGMASAATTLNVHVKNPADVAVGSVTVAAIEFGMNGPSTHTQIGLTDASGNATFILEDNKSYNLYYSSHGYSPSISDQFNNPEYDQNRYVWTSGTPRFSTFTVTLDQTNVGRLEQQFTGATFTKILFGGVYNMTSQMQGGSGIVMTDGSGNGTLVVDNVPYADANTYNIGLYDPEKNKGIGRNVMSALDATAPEIAGVRTISYIGAAMLNFNQAVPPARVENDNKQGGGSSAGASVEGVIQEFGYSTATIGHIGIGVKACVGNQWNTWANTDDNGRFQLYGLTPGVTYYLNVMGGCTWKQNSNESTCYEPYSSSQYNAQDICANGINASVNANDVVYISSDVMYHIVQLNRMPKSIGQISVYVKSTSGARIPNSNVNLNPDGSPWPLNPLSCSNQNNYQQFSSTNFVNNAGFSNANVNATTGYALLDGLPSGNYMLNVWTPFSSGGNGQAGFNGGPDGQFSFGNDMMGGGNMNWMAAHCVANYGADDYRITIATSATPNGPPAAQTMHVYDSSGTELALSSITYIVTAGGNNSGLVTGTVRFPSTADLSNNPITITLYGQCDMNQSTSGPSNCPSGNFTAIDGSGANQYTYTIPVSSGYSYNMNVTANGWGRINRGGGNNNIDLASTGTITVDMDFAPAGTITGTVYKPGGTEILTPTNNQWISVNAGSNNGWSSSQLQKDGTFALTDVLPGLNRLQFYAGSSGGSSFNYTLPSPAPTVMVTAGAATTFNLNLVKSNLVGVDVTTNTLPDSSVITDGGDTILGFRVISLPAGTVLKGETISKLLTNGGDDGQISYSPPTGGDGSGRCGNNWPGGFCAASFPSPAVYDFYLMRSGDFSKSSSTAVSAPYPHFTLISSSKNVIIDDAHANSVVYPGMMGMDISSGVAINLTPAVNMSDRGNATLSGAVTAANFFRNADYEATGGDFDNFVKYLPVVSLYDSNGAFSAAGVVLPPPSYIAEHDQEFDISFAQGYPQFKTLLDGAGAYGYEIRGLAPSTCYTAVLTTPNYPPYQSRVCMGVTGSTKTLSINLDSAVGAGATLQGVVTSTMAVNLANTEVQISGEGVDARSVVTNSSGAYKFEGLPAGTVRIKAALDGYASAEAEKDLTGSNIYTQSFQLTAAGGSITGTVYSQKLPFAKVQAGAQIMAYNDTYNGNNPALPLPLLKTKTGADGAYRLAGLVPGDTYKVFLKVPGKFPMNQSVAATAGNTAGIDFTMLHKPMDLEIFIKKGQAAFEFTVKNPQEYTGGLMTWCEAPYAVGASTLTLTKLSSGELRGEIPLSILLPNKTYVLHAVGYKDKQKVGVVREILFGKSYKGNADQQIDEAILGDDSDDGFGRKNNEAAMDASGDDASALSFPTGAMLAVSTAAVPTCSIKGEDKDDVSVQDKVEALGADAFAGDLYTVALSSVSINEDKGFEISLAYDKSTADLDDLAVARYNDTTAKWEDVPAVATINPVKGTVKVKLKSLASVLAVKNGMHTQAFSSFNGHEYMVRPMSGGSSSSAGTFAVVRPSLAGNNFTGAKMKVFNYPNPFNLKDKAINNTHGAALPATVNGTVIHVEVPAGNGGPGHVRIYTLAGELVKDISVTFEAGKYNYVGWDGHNKGGQEVANGVYYGVVEMSGKSVKLKDATFKMAVIK